MMKLTALALLVVALVACQSPYVFPKPRGLADGKTVPAPSPTASVQTVAAGYWYDSTSGADVPRFWIDGTPLDLVSVAGYSAHVNAVAVGSQIFGGGYYLQPYGALKNGSYPTYKVPALWTQTTVTPLEVDATKALTAEVLAMAATPLQVYSAGYWIDSTQGYVPGASVYQQNACFWTGSVRTDLPYPAAMEYATARAIAVDSGTVYTAGDYTDPAHSSRPIPCYWVGTTRTDLEDVTVRYGQARGLAVASGHVYVVGSSNPWGTSVPSLWTDGVRTDLSVGAGATGGQAEGVAVPGDGHVYVCGYWLNAGIAVACFWVDGARTDLPAGSGNSYAHQISVSSGVPQIAGSWTNGGPYVPCVWQNGVKSDLLTSGTASAFSLAVGSVAAGAAAPGSVAYPSPSSPFYVGEPLGPLTPGATSPSPTAFGSATILPIGVSVDVNTGTLSGSPLFPSPATSYTIRGTNSAGAASAVVTFAVASQFAALPVTLATAHQYGQAVALADGRVLILGGNFPTTTAEIYDPATGTLTATGAMVHGRTHFTATLIDRGPWKDQVLVAGDNSVTTGATSELFDPAANAGVGGFSAGPALSQNRGSHTATLLADGRILLFGGNTGLNADLWDPATNTVSTNHPQQILPRIAHAAVRLSDGRVLIAGGWDYNGNVVTGAAELFDPLAAGGIGAFAATGSLAQARQVAAGVLLPASGKVLIVGGSTATGNAPDAELFDPAAAAGVGAFTVTGTLHQDRQGPTANLLPDGKVLVAGGFGNSYPQATAEMYDPGTGLFRKIGDMTSTRENHFSVTLADGSVLVGGGDMIVGAYYVKNIDKYK